MLPVLLAAALAPAAPVPPPNPNHDRERLEALWTGLASADPLARTEAAFALADHPAAVKFLAAKAPPVKASEEQIKGWMTDLNSGQEKEANAAFEKLQYFDPQLALTPAEQLPLVTTDYGRRLLASLWWGEPFTPESDSTFNTLKIDGHDSFTFVQHYRTPSGSESSSDHNGTLFGIAHHKPDDWKRAALAAVVLDRIDTKASREALLKLASGHPDALPTRTAVAALRARFALPSPLPDHDWAKLLDFEPVQTTRWAFELADHPERVRALKGKLPAITATKAEVTGWLTALNNDRAEVWKPAFAKLLYFRPSLALGLREQCDLMTTDHGRCAFHALCDHPSETPAVIKVRRESRLSVPGDKFVFVKSIDDTRDDRLLPVIVWPLTELNAPHWWRIRIAVLALQRAGTPEAKAVLRQLAGGHPDILPTREAKAALK